MNHQRDQRTRVEVQHLFDDLEVPDEIAERVVEASLEEEPSTHGSRPLWGAIVLIAILLLAIPTFIALRRPVQPAAGVTTRISAEGDDGFSLSNREGLLVLRSPNGQILNVTGTRDD